MQKLVGTQYSWLSSIFYFGYLLWEYPTTLLIQKLPIGKYLSSSVAAWGAVVAASAASNNFAGLAVSRFLLGFLEATSVPSFVYIISQWYTRDETPLRTALWFVGTEVGSIVAALIIYGLGHGEETLEPWRLMFIVSMILVRSPSRSLRRINRFSEASRLSGGLFFSSFFRIQSNLPVF